MKTVNTCKIADLPNVEFTNSPFFDMAEINAFNHVADGQVYGRGIVTVSRIGKARNYAITLYCAIGNAPIIGKFKTKEEAIEHAKNTTIYWHQDEGGYDMVKIFLTKEEAEESASK